MNRVPYPTYGGLSVSLPDAFFGGFVTSLQTS